MTTALVARFFADTIPPMLAALNLIAAWRAASVPAKSQARRIQVHWFGRYLLCFVLGVAVPVALAEAGKKWQVWPGHPGFPSGHETFTVSAVTCLVRLHGQRWLAMAIPVSALMGWALVRAGFHHPPEVAGAVVLGLAGAAGICRLLRPTPPPEVFPEGRAKKDGEAIAGASRARR